MLTHYFVYVLLSETDVLVDFARLLVSGDFNDVIDIKDYVIISVEDDDVYNPNNTEQFMVHQYGDHEIYEIPESLVAFQAVLLLAPSAPSNPYFYEFQNDVYERGHLPPFSIPKNEMIERQIPIVAGLAYDAVMVYAIAATSALERGENLADGEKLLDHIKGLQYESILGFSVTIDNNGDAEGNYTLLALLQTERGSNKSMKPVGTFTHQNNSSLPLLHIEHPIQWIAGKPPVSEPQCGFYGELCTLKPNWLLISVCSLTGLLMLIASSFAFRHYRYEHKLACLLWKVDIREIKSLRRKCDYPIECSKSNINLIEREKLHVKDRRSSPSPVSVRLEKGEENEIEGNTICSDENVGRYKGNLVFVRRVNKKNIDLTRTIRKELIQMRDLRHENINPFIGASVDAPNILILTLYCGRGSLQDVLKNEDLDLDNMFMASLVADLIKGMMYLHDSEIVSHGNLKSSNCLVDSRWVLQIADFGLHEFKAGQEKCGLEQEKQRYSSLWRAPELLRQEYPPAQGTQKGDVYSFAIVLHEIMTRAGPWGGCGDTVDEIRDKVTNPSNYGNSIHRPPVRGLKCADYIISCMIECWHENPESRPDFKCVNEKLKRMQTGLKANIFDNMIALMEKYSSNLEAVVQERTTQLVGEKKKTEQLLLRMLPKSVAEQLKRGVQVEAESFDCVTIYFSDIVGFTALSAESTPLQVVNLLNDLYTLFDEIIENYEVYKVETIGDAYMVVSGLPIRNGNTHAGHIASMAIHLLTAIQNFEIKHKSNERLKLRIGIHSGQCVAGVVGLKMPRYCLFGDTVNTASRMESTGEALKIHVSEDCKNILDKLGGYILEERGLTFVKGKGEMRTYWLLGKCTNNGYCQSRRLRKDYNICLCRNEKETSESRLSLQSHTDTTSIGTIEDNTIAYNDADGTVVNIRKEKLNSKCYGENNLNSYLKNEDSCIEKRYSDVSLPESSGYSSCLNLFQEYGKHILRDFHNNSFKFNRHKNEQKTKVTHNYLS
ncbi:guanylate cyclase 32E-like protein [Leptotrombidium deliense]|uniref:Guanylate cyclase n=1 Tax=Leptotrombidium deliense TaxID=299467 RepID=A0A443SF91_9ACAR|nr:guanylate cyclase 32E-like protein [Leptotrombidium deliense]